MMGDLTDLFLSVELSRNGMESAASARLSGVAMLLLLLILLLQGARMARARLSGATRARVERPPGWDWGSDGLVRRATG
jgi:hypothetical protein